MEKKTCFTCATEITPYAAYCEECVEKQIKANGGLTEEEAFDAFHAFADEIGMVR